MLLTLGITAVAAGAAAEDAVPGPVVTVRDVLGVPTFVVGDKPFVVPCFETYTPTEYYFRQFAEAGVELFSFNTNVAACDYGHSTPVWLDPDTWDYSNFEERMERVLRAKPDAMVMPRINMGTPLWWLEANPDELEVLDHGSTLYKEPNRNPTLPKDRPFPAIGSQKWRDDMAMALERFLDHVHQSKYGDHIFGYILAGVDTEEWYHWSSGSNQLTGYSEPTRRAFQEWVRRKYRTEEALQQAWNRPGLTFDAVVVPSREERFDLEQGTFRDPSVKMNVIDFYHFYNDVMPEMIDHFAAVVRRKTQGTKAIGAFYGYMYEFRGDPEYGHNALAKFNASENLDFIFVTASYENRAPGTGADYSRAPAFSVRLHNKLWYHDNDVASFLAPQVLRRVGIGDDAEDWSRSLQHHLNVLGYTDTPERSRWMYRRSMGFALCSGAYESYFDLHGGYYDHPELMDEVRVLNRVAEVAKRYYRTSNSEILIVADERSCAYPTFRSRMLEQTLLSPQVRLLKSGAPADHVLLDDLELLDTRPYKLVVFLNCYNMTDRQRELVREKVTGNGRHVVWCYAPGYFNENQMSVEAMRDISGMRIVPGESEEYVVPGIELTNADHPVVRTLRAGDGVVTGPEFQDPGNTSMACARLFHVDDPGAKVLGVLPGTGKATFAVKDMDDWTSVYVITSNLAPAAFREIARNADVHIYNEQDDAVYVNTTFFSIHADGAGERTIRFPWACDIFDMITEEYVAVNTDSYTCHMEHGETRILRWKTRL